MQQHLRLRRSADFEHIRKTGRSFQHRLMVLSLTPNGLTHNRYGFVTSKRLGKAVTRNRVRRLLREGVRLLHPQLEPGFDVVIVARQQLVGQPFSTVQRIVKELAYQAGLLVDYA